MDERYLRAVRSLVDTLHVSVNDALEMARIPPQIRDGIRVRYEEETALPIRRAHILSERGGPRNWFESWDPSTGYYWRRQRSYLIDRRGFNQAEIGSLDDATDRILSHMEDPRNSGPAQFDVRGLVMGYVQSGKTANFCALAAKAADVGYKLVIVLSGIHNSLRLQTQRRINRALGLDPTGVPEPDPGWRWIGLTSATLGGDFHPGTIDANVLQGNERVLIVCKKNATVLRRLTRWIEHRAPASLPVLVIDDEADQASINTGGNRLPQDAADLVFDDLEDPRAADELDPSVINGLVRMLVRSFGRVAYVAYTATPFANVLINHLAIDQEVFEDLYPRDFIVALPRPYGYTGAERLFGREALPGEDSGEPGLDIINLVPESEAALLTPRSVDVLGYEPVLPASMRTAFLDFVLATSARSQRSSADFPATMLIHTHHRTPVQDRLGERLRQLLSDIRQTWRYDRESIRPELVDRWNMQFRPTIAAFDLRRDCDFKVIEDHVEKLFRDPIPVLVLNSSSTDELDYDKEPHLKAVVVGGNRLSRGLTLEGLVVSYYLRRAEAFDTLMQMGRWFGFREGYVELTRIWTTSELSGWFRDLALAEEELRREIARYEREGLTPLEFAPRIRSHPAMMITARNKMGSARRIAQNYSGYLLQTTAFRLHERPWLVANLNAARRLITGLGDVDTHLSGVSQPTWVRVPWQTVDAFLGAYNFDPRGTNEMSAVRQYIQAQARQGELIEWTISIRGRALRNDQLGDEPILTVAGTAMNRIARTRLRSTPHSIGSLVNPATQSGAGDEEIGLASHQIEAARALAAQGVEYPSALRRQRSRSEGLLLLYPISPHSRPQSSTGIRLPLFEDPSRDGCTVVGIAIAFPVSDSAATIEYVVGSVGFEDGEE